MSSLLVPGEKSNTICSTDSHRKEDHELEVHHALTGRQHFLGVVAGLWLSTSFTTNY